MKGTMRFSSILILSSLVLFAVGCAGIPQGGNPLTKYEPVKIYNAPLQKVYDALKQAMTAENYKWEVAQINPDAGSATIVTGYILAPSTVNFYTDDKGQKKPCQVKYLIHADLRTQEDGRTMLDLPIPEVTEFHKPDIGAYWDKTDTMSWRGKKLQDAVSNILSGKAPAPSPAPAPSAPPAAPPKPAKQEGGPKK